MPILSSSSTLFLFRRHFSASSGNSIAKVQWIKFVFFVYFTGQETFPRGLKGTRPLFCSSKLTFSCLGFTPPNVYSLWTTKRVSLHELCVNFCTASKDDVPDFSLLNQSINALHTPWVIRIPCVVKQVLYTRFKSFKRSSTVCLMFSRAAVKSAGCHPHKNTNSLLIHYIAERCQSFTNQFFICEWPVYLGGVKKSYTQVKCSTYKSLSVFFIYRFHRKKLSPMHPIPFLRLQVPVIPKSFFHICIY